MARAALHRRRDQWESSGSEVDSDHSSRSRPRCGSTTVSPGAVVSISDSVGKEEDEISPSDLAEKQKKAHEFALRRKQHYNMGQLLRKGANPPSVASVPSDTSLAADDDDS